MSSSQAHEGRTEAPRRKLIWSRATRVTGWGILLLTVLPLGAPLRNASGPAAAQFEAWRADRTAPVAAAVALVLVLGALLAPALRRLHRPAPPRDVGGRSAVGLPPVGRDGIAAGAAIAAAAAAWAFSYFALGAGPYLVDGTTQLVQARLFAAGNVAIAEDAPTAFFHFQYLAESSRGWTSQYPPGFALLLALGIALGTASVVGPVLHGLTAWLGVRLVRRMFPRDTVLLIAAAALFVASPFALALAGAYMNHGASALLGLAGVAAALRWAGDRRWLWATVAGASLGAMATIRPLSALSIGVVVAAGPWLLGAAPPSRPRIASWFGGLTAGAILPVAGLLAYNQMLFGAPLAFGYEAAQGPSHGLGFHDDPWGARYTPLLALAYSSTELEALGHELAGAPLPLTVMIGAVAALSRQAGARILFVLLWALAPVIAGLFYWHHDLSMGPRLLADAAPAWILATAWMVGRMWNGPRGASATETLPSLRMAFMRGVVVAAGMVALAGTPVRLVGYGTRADTAAASIDPEPGSIVFVHGPWSARIGARLVERGARVDVVRQLARRYTNCELQRFLDGTEAGRDRFRLPATESRAGAPAERRLVERRMPSGSVILTYSGEALTPACRREAESDFRGVIELPRLIWRGDLPGAERGRAMFARDMGPDRNGRLLAAYPEREAWLLVRREDRSLALLPYADGMTRVWSEPAEDLAP